VIGQIGRHFGQWDFELRDDALAIGGRTLSEIASAVGSTPFYVYSGGAITRRVRAVRQALPSAVELHYAIKANPMPEVVRLLGTLVDGFDVASAGELAVAVTTDMQRNCISFAGPGKRDSELEAAVRAQCVVNLESANEMRRLHAVGIAVGARPAAAVRVNPDFELKSSGMKMSGGPKPFGVDAVQVPELLREMRTTCLDFQGFHIFSGSQNLRADAIIESQTRALELATALAASAPAAPRFVNLGGGFGIPYFPGERPLAIDPIGTHLETLVAAAQRDLPGTRIVLELGRYLVGEAGLYVCRVIDRKVSAGQIFLVTDGGLHQHLAASGNFGQVLRKNYPVVVAHHVLGGEREVASVVGPLCTPLDLLADRMELAAARPGDLVAVLQSGAYGFTASPTRFLSHPEPREILV
jgi:diaminopimelate decarboxylase